MHIKPDHFQINFSPIANQDAIVTGPHYRFSVLSTYPKTTSRFKTRRVFTGSVEITSLSQQNAHLRTASSRNPSGLVEQNR